jgi:hypothetical protein
MNDRSQGLTISRITAWIGKPRTLVSHLLPAAERENPPKSKLFGTVACLKTNLAEFSHPLNQCSQVWCYFRFPPLINNMR